MSFSFSFCLPFCLGTLENPFLAFFLPLAVRETFSYSSTPPCWLPLLALLLVSSKMKSSHTLLQSKRCSLATMPSINPSHFLVKPLNVVLTNWLSRIVSPNAANSSLTCVIFLRYEVCCCTECLGNVTMAQIGGCHPNPQSLHLSCLPITNWGE